MSDDREHLLDLLAMALPYVEDALDDPCHKPYNTRLQILVRDIRKAVEGKPA